MIERRYEVLEALGTGGFGTVYRARYQGEGGFSQMVALKILNPEMAGVDEIASRLRDEARVLGLLRHRAIVQVHRLVQLDDSWTVVMEFVEGADLSQVLASGQRVPVGPALEIVSEVAAALNVAWTAPGPSGRPLRLLHRDIKPSNIQITPVGEVKVLDFGIARADFAQREALTQKLAFGSTEYMSPERLDMRDGPAADVYSLGAVLYEILTGQGLGRTSAVRDRHVPRIDDAMATVSEAIGSSHTAIIELVGDMLTWDPKNRPTARVIERRALTLRSHIAGEPLRFWAED
ncbi:MAG: serine/threonine protein kinase, partial [Oligoflexia bacterium]|nr:serine/threonine protein kinase [Oligoflexia bacterium]